MLDLEDIAGLSREQRKPVHWRRLGEHHGQAAIARTVKSIRLNIRVRYLSALLAAAEHEFSEAANAEDSCYLQGYAGVLRSFIDASQEVTSYPSHVTRLSA